MNKDRAKEYEICLLRVYGAVISSPDLYHVLGYRTGDAFRQAVRRKKLPVPTFIPAGRKARVARTHDIAIWLASMDTNIEAIIPSERLE